MPMRAPRALRWACPSGSLTTVRRAAGTSCSLAALALYVIAVGITMAVHVPLNETLNVRYDGSRATTWYSPHPAA